MTHGQEAAHVVSSTHAETIGARLLHVAAHAAAEQTALIDRDGQYSYRQFAAALRQTAAHLQQRIGVGGGATTTYVISFLPHGALSLIVQAAVIASGHTLVPLVAEQGELLQRSIIDQVRPALIVTTRAMPPLVVDGAAVLFADELSDDVAAPLLPAGAADQDALIVFTSGSTGRPRGVRVPHRALLFDTDWKRAERSITAESRFLHAHADVYIVGVLSSLCALCAGATVVAFSAHDVSIAGLYQVMVRTRVTYVSLLMPLLRRLAEQAQLHGPIPSLRCVITAGESVSLADIGLLRCLMPSDGMIVYSMGASEVITFARRNLHGDQALSPEIISSALLAPGTTVFIVDEQYRPLPPGSVGEIVVCAQTIANGYFADEAASAARFPFAPDGSGRRAFRSGDLGRLHADGRLEHLGRRDDQVKIRGYRLELSTVNHALSQISTLREGTASAADIAGERTLIAYIVWRSDSARSLTELRAELAQLLPSFAVPTRFFVLDALPRGVSGKVERTALPAPVALRPELESAYVAPTTALERQLAAMWCDVLTLGDVGIDDDFFLLGGDSLLLFRLLTRLEREFGVQIELQQLTTVTIRRLGSLLTPTDADSAVQSTPGARRMSAGAIGSRLVLRYLPYGPTQYLLRKLLDSPFGRRRTERAAVQWRRIAAAGGIDAEQTLLLHLAANSLPEWRIHAVQQPSAARWLDVHGLEHLAQRPAGRGVVLVTTHSVLTGVVSGLVKDRIDTDSVVVNVRGDHAEGEDHAALRHLNLQRSRQLVRTRRRLEQGGAALVIGDGRAGHGGVEAELLRRTVMIRHGAAELAVSTDAWYVPTFVMLAAAGGVTVEFCTPVVPTADPAALTAYFVAELLRRLPALLPSYDRRFVLRLLAHDPPAGR